MVTISTSKKEYGKIGDLVLDVTLRENHDYTNEITDYPIEDGFNINDHIRPLPEKLMMEGFITNSPISAIDVHKGTFRDLTREDNSNRDILAFNQLLEYGGFEIPKQLGDIAKKTKAPEILDILTTLKLYTNMVIKSISFPVDRTTDNSIKFNIQFKKIEMVYSDITIINNSKNINGKAPNIKNQTGKTTDTGVSNTKKVKEESVLFKIGRGVKKYF